MSQQVNSVAEKRWLLNGLITEASTTLHAWLNLPCVLPVDVTRGSLVQFSLLTEKLCTRAMKVTITITTLAEGGNTEEVGFAVETPNFQKREEPRRGREVLCGGKSAALSLNFYPAYFKVGLC